MFRDASRLLTVLPAASDPTDERVVCRCLGVTEDVILSALTTGLVQSVRDLGRCTGAGTGCTACHAQLRRYLAEHAYSLDSEPICSVR